MRVPDMQPVQPPPAFIGTASPLSRYSPRQSCPASTTITSTTTATPAAHTSAPGESSGTQVQHLPPPPTDDGDDDQVHQRARWPHGLRMQRDFITRDHEAELVRLFREELEWPARGKGRVSLHYGYTFSYKTFGIDEDVPFKEFPGWLRPLIPLLPLRDEGEDVVGGGEDEDQGQDDDGNGLERVVEDEGRDGGDVQRGSSDTAEARNSRHQEEPQHRQRQMLQQQRRRRQQRQKEERHKHAALGGRPPDQVCLQYYPPGTGIPPHVDTHSTYDELYALSLGAPVLMQFRLDGVFSASSPPLSLPSLSSEQEEDEDRARDRVRSDRSDDGGGSGGSADHDGTPALVNSTGTPGQGETVAPIQQHQQVPPTEPEEATLLPPKPERAQVELDLLPRSMLEMSGDSRLHWTHGIKPRKTDTLTDQIFGPDSLDGSSAAPAPLPPVVRPREDRWSITYRWLRKEVPAPALTRSAISGGEEAGSNGSSHREGREADSTTTTMSSGADSSSSPRGHCGGGEMVRECECGDVLLCDTAQRRRGQEREYRWKQYDAAA